MIRFGIARLSNQLALMFGLAAYAISWLFCCAAIVQADETQKLPADHAARMQAGTLLFKNQVGAILRDHCLECHGGKSVKGELDITSRETLVASGYVDLDDIASSHLLDVLNHATDPHMPKDADKLPQIVIDAIAQWLKLGAPYDRSLAANTDSDPTKPSPITEEERNFWSFRPLTPAAPPANLVSSWPKTPIDEFIVKRLQQLGVEPNPLTDRRHLIRRAYFDLLGLPPSAEQAEAFIHDSDPDAYEKLLDRLLESPHYGERWARHWMDIARFGESHGYEQDYDRPHAYHYRDFLIRALNDDMPFDKFVQLQIAGDELEPENPLALMATGFLGAGVFPTQLTEMEFESSRYDELDDMVATLGTSVLGLSIGCARCHAHKFDPIPAKDYYRLIANLSTTIRSEIELDLEPAENRKRREQFDANLMRTRRELADYEQSQLEIDMRQWLSNYPIDAVERSDISGAAKSGLSPTVGIDPLDSKTREAIARLKTNWDAKSPDYELAREWFSRNFASYRQRISAVQELEKRGPEIKLTKVQVSSEGLPHTTHHADARGFPHFYPETHFLNRGDVTQKKEVVSPGFLQVLMRNDYSVDHWSVAQPEGWTRTSFRRAALANWITDVQHGAGHLAARVIVNRIWQHHFGSGLVATPNDFGRQGELPSHPELLDWLAVDLVQHGWKLKRLHKLIMTSAVYMQSSEADELRSLADRENRSLWRFPPRRLEAEAIRDTLLSVSGQLDPTMYGPGTLDPTMRRRSIYFFIKRSQLIPMMVLFDWPEHQVSIGQRSTTTVAPQALALLNDPECRKFAEGFAARFSGEATQVFVTHAYKHAFSRVPTQPEEILAKSFVKRQAAVYGPSDDDSAQQRARIDFCQVLLSMNELFYVD